MDIDTLLDEALQRPLIGFDASYDGRIVAAEPWDFTSIVAQHARSSTALLDLGTGGGEWLSRLPNRPVDTVATEGWPPNVPIAHERLAQLGIKVVGVDAAPYNVAQATLTAVGSLPFSDSRFDLVTSRHESYLPREVNRVLARGGCFLTQQVASGASDDLYVMLGQPIPEVKVAWNLAFAVQQLESAGLVLDEAQEGFSEKRFQDVGALAWYLQHMPFVVPGFSINASRDKLAGIAKSGQPLIVRQPLFWLRAYRTS